MRFRAYLILVAIFFVTMNYLLWRSEFSPRGRLGASVPAEMVWEKVLTCPDNSFLEIRHKGRKVGRAHWSANISEDLTSEKSLDDELPPEGMVNALTGYTLDFNGSLSVPDLPRIRFTCDLRLTTNQTWQQLTLKILLKPDAWELIASAPQQKLRFISDDEEGRREHVFSFVELQNPERLAKAIGGPLLPATLAAMGLSLNPGTTSLSVGLKWEARHDWLKLGLNPIRVYRIEARLFDRFKAVLIVSPVGEILRMELPDDIVLSNEALVNL